MMNITRVVCGTYAENAYLICPESGAHCLLIDPGDDLSALNAAIADSGRKLAAILLTHAHFDHTLAAKPLAEAWSVPIYLHAADAEMLCDPGKNAYPGAPVANLPCPAGLSPLPYPENVFPLEGISFRILHTPGHTMGGVCLYCEAEKIVFSGDTLFADGFGRMDLYGGSHKQMRVSLRMLLSLPEDVRLLPGHGGETTIGAVRGKYLR